MAVDRSASLVDVLYQEIIPRLSVEAAYPTVEFRFRTGRYWRGGCPLHGGTDPNFSVDTQTLSWNCFSHCGHGSYITYLNGGETARGGRFVELVRALAEHVGLVLDTAPRSPAQVAAAQRQSLLEGFVALAAETLSEPAGAHVVHYLAKRGFPEDAAQLARIGFGAQPSRTALASLRASKDELAAAGLDNPSWSGRLLIPWRDDYGRIATIAARTTLDEEPRYLYRKGASRPPFFAPGRRNIRSFAAPVIVEGLVDALLLHHAGIDEVLAVGGTLATESHADWLIEHGVTAVSLLLDADRAGIQATRKWIDALARFAPAIAVTAIPAEAYSGAKDPAELLASRGLPSHADLLSARLPALMWLAGQVLSGITRDSPVGTRRQALQKLRELAGMASGPERRADLEDLAQLAAARLGYSDMAVREALGLSPAPTPPDGIGSAGPTHGLGTGTLGDDVVRVLRSANQGFALYRLTHVLMNSQGLLTQRLIATHAITGVPSASLLGRAPADARTAVREACLSDPRITIDKDDWAQLAPGANARTRFGRMH